MRRVFTALLAVCSISVSAADQSDVPLPATAQQRAARPRQAPPVAAATGATKPAGATTAAPGTEPAMDTPKFTSEGKWILAGYNNNEVVYTIIVTSQDSRIIRCTTDVQGFHLENGDKQTISDRQVTTVFPNQPTQVGNWMDMDQASGATYTVKCRPS
jgi:hypothetical protein